MTAKTGSNPQIDLELYGGEDPRDRPLYTFRDASRATDIPPSTIRAWVVGQSYPRRHDSAFFEPVIRRPSDEDSRLSFTNLIEIHVLRALRKVHEVSLGSIREAIDVAQREFGIERLLISPQLRTSAGKLFLDRYTHLLELSEAKQLTMRAVLAQYLERVEYDASSLPVELQPFERLPNNYGDRIIGLSPFVSFGRALLRRTGVSTRAVVQRLEAGEPFKAVLDDYGLQEAELEEAILYETAA